MLHLIQSRSHLFAAFRCQPTASAAENGIGARGNPGVGSVVADRNAIQVSRGRNRPSVRTGPNLRFSVFVSTCRPRGGGGAAVSSCWLLPNAGKRTFSGTYIMRHSSTALPRQTRNTGGLFLERVLLMCWVPACPAR